MARTGYVTHPVLASINIAREINLQMGGAVISWLEVDQLDEETIDVFNGLAVDLKEYRQGLQRVEAVKERIRAQYRRKN